MNRHPRHDRGAHRQQHELLLVAGREADRRDGRSEIALLGEVDRRTLLVAGEEAGTDGADQVEARSSALSLGIGLSRYAPSTGVWLNATWVWRASTGPDSGSAAPSTIASAAASWRRPWTMGSSSGSSVGSRSLGRRNAALRSAGSAWLGLASPTVPCAKAATKSPPTWRSSSKAGAALVVAVDAPVVDVERGAVDAEPGQHADRLAGGGVEAQQRHRRIDVREVTGVVVEVVGRPRSIGRRVRHLAARHRDGRRLPPRIGLLDRGSDAADDDLVVQRIEADHAVEQVEERVPGDVGRCGVGVGRGEEHVVGAEARAVAVLGEALHDAHLDALIEVEHAAVTRATTRRSPPRRRRRARRGAWRARASGRPGCCSRCWRRRSGPVMSTFAAPTR